MNKILIPAWLASNIYCLLQLLYIYISARRANFAISKEIKSYRYLISVIILAFLADSVSRLYTYEDLRSSLHSLILISTHIKYLTMPLVVPFFYRYYSLQIKGPLPKAIKNINIGLWIIYSALALTILSSYFTNWVFYYDANYIYHRGELYNIPVFTMLSISAIAELSIIKYKNLLSKTHYIIFVTFLGIPVIGMLFQALFYGLALGLMGTSFALIIIYINVISKDINKDHLTSLNDRKAFDLHLEEFILDKSSHPFGAIMLDIDDFKTINDNYGHAEGDEALKSTAEIIAHSVRNNDIICRYGGDEFVVILQKCDEEILSTLLGRLRKNFNSFNNEPNRQYQIKASVGGAIFSKSKHKDASGFIKCIDGEMYLDKKKNKKL